MRVRQTGDCRGERNGGGEGGESPRPQPAAGAPDLFQFLIRKI
jgi:hypothetical protein